MFTFKVQTCAFQISKFLPLFYALYIYRTKTEVLLENLSATKKKEYP